MVTKEQIINGIVKYIDNEVLPALPTASKWALGTYATILLSKSDQLYQKLVSSEFITLLGIIDENGLIDVTTLAAALSKSACNYGKLSVNIPLVGNLTFSDKDIEKVVSYIGD